MRTEKEKMLAGEPYDAWDTELYQARIGCRKVLQKLNNSIPDTDEWRCAIDELIPDSKGPTLSLLFDVIMVLTSKWVKTSMPTSIAWC